MGPCPGRCWRRTGGSVGPPATPPSGPRAPSSRSSPPPGSPSATTPKAAPSGRWGGGAPAVGCGGDRAIAPGLASLSHRRTHTPIMSFFPGLSLFGSPPQILSPISEPFPLRAAPCTPLPPSRDPLLPCRRHPAGSKSSRGPRHRAVEQTYFVQASGNRFPAPPRRQYPNPRPTDSRPPPPAFHYVNRCGVPFSNMFLNRTIDHSHLLGFRTPRSSEGRSFP